jgi:hypothetical protein
MQLPKFPRLRGDAGTRDESLQKMGTTFLLRQRSWRMVCGTDARQGQGCRSEKDLRANLIPGVVIVPAMVIAIEKARSRHRVQQAVTRTDGNSEGDVSISYRRHANSDFPAF